MSSIKPLSDRERAEQGGARSGLEEPTTETKVQGGRSVHVSPGYGVALSTVDGLEDTSALRSAHNARGINPQSYIATTSPATSTLDDSLLSPTNKPVSGFQRLQMARTSHTNRFDDKFNKSSFPSSKRESIGEVSEVDQFKVLSPADVVIDTNVSFALHKTSQNDRTLKKLKQTLERWLNRYLQKDQMAVRDIFTEMYDGELLMAFLTLVTGKNVYEGEDLSGGNVKSSVQRVTACLNFIIQTLKLPYNPERWTVEGIVMNNFGALISLLVDLAYILGCPYNLPQNVIVAITRNEDVNGTQKSRTLICKITSEEHFQKLSSIVKIDTTLRIDLDEADEDTDVFDEISNNPEKMKELSTLLLEFVNSQLEMINSRLDSLNSLEPLQLIFLLGILGNVFVPTKMYHLPAMDYNAHLENAKMALLLMNEFDISTNRILPNDLVSKDIRTISRCVYFIFKRFRTGDSDM